MYNTLKSFGEEAGDRVHTDLDHVCDSQVPRFTVNEFKIKMGTPCDLNRDTLSEAHHSNIMCQSVYGIIM